MGAYYQAVCTGTNEAISPSITEDFYKLMEHSWIGNEFLNLVLHNIHKGSWKNQPVVWSCDYDDDSLWNVAKSISFSEDVIHTSKWKGYEDCIILNNSKKEFIDLAEYKQQFFYRGEGTVHPFSLLTSQATHSMGGGDYHADSADRGRWSGDKFVVTFNKHKIPSEYKNISDVFFSDNPEEIEIRNNAFIEKCGNSEGPDLFSNKPISLLKLVKGASKKELKELLSSGDSWKLTFEKKDGTIATRNANTRDDNSYYHIEDDSPLFAFFDIDADKPKKFIFENFIEAVKA
jgi:hypothetical protein